MSTEHKTPLGDIYARLIALAEELGGGITAEQIESIAKAVALFESQLPRPEPLTLTKAAREALSYIICTATEGGHYTREDFHEWDKYVHHDEEGGRFYAEVTVTPNDDKPGVACDPIRMTPEELGQRLHSALSAREEGEEVAPQHRTIIHRLLDGDEDVAGECDVIDAGALMQIAVYGEVIYG